MKISSSAFDNQARIPIQYTCEGENISPPLSWQGVPKDAKVLVLIVDDPDAPRGTFTHWIIYNMPLLPPHLGADASLKDRFSEGLREGQNDFGEQGYGGPCPPKGDGKHRYFFRLFALNQLLEFTGRVTREQVMTAIEGKVLTEAVLMGTYSRV